MADWLQHLVGQYFLGLSDVNGYPIVLQTHCFPTKELQAISFPNNLES
jgi:hypothetical protein